jgi:uncharacterized glyoxalase superfamily protein PhnB
MNMDTSQSARFKHAVPTLPVRDAVAAQKYYCDVLGFKAEFMLNDSAGKPHFAGVSRDGVRLYLTTVNGEVHPGECTFAVESVDAVFAEFKAKGARIKREPRDVPWGREFTMFDLDRNYLAIGIQ